MLSFQPKASPFLRPSAAMIRTTSAHFDDADPNRKPVLSALSGREVDDFAQAVARVSPARDSRDCGPRHGQIVDFLLRCAAMGIGGADGEFPVADAEYGRDPVDVNRLVAGAARTIASVPYCWLATWTAGGLPSMRPMGRLPRGPGDDDWTIRFVTDGRSRKASDIRRAPEVTLLFQRDADDAYVVLTGSAKVITEESEVRRLWKDAYAPFFPTETDRANAAFLEFKARRLELWIRGVTPEPFGLQATTIERDTSGAWRLVGDQSDADRSPSS
jgi:general stress protein 26